ncbi:MAG: cupredoxin domain-containing protein [Chloroflexi bacterium]|nr:cupredoxin domain-containing protein [Chloroflexota bacterium]
MEHEGSEHNAHVGPDVHLPDPSIWPFVAGLAIMLLTATLVWWARVEDQRSLSGPLLGASAAITLFAVAGWAYEDGRMRQKAREEEEHARAPARRTQVITFAIAEGQLEAAVGEGGVIDAIQNAHDDLRASPGFEDLRINVSTAEEGPSQVIVETTWSTGDDLAAFEETERAILDLISQHPDEVVAGSPQTFDMQVVRDTKDTSVRFSMGATVSLFGALLVGGFAVGAGLNLFASEASGGEGTVIVRPDDVPFVDTLTIKASDFSHKEITLPPGVDFTMTLDNQDDSVAHNIIFYQGEDLEGPVLEGCLEGCEDGGTAVRTALELGIIQQTFTFTTPPPGRYAFWCDVHPDTMIGVLIIEEGAPIPGVAPPADDAAGGAGTGAEGGAEGTEGGTEGGESGTEGGTEG